MRRAKRLSFIIITPVVAILVLICFAVVHRFTPLHASAFYNIERQSDGVYRYSLTGADGLLAVRRVVQGDEEPSFEMVSTDILEVSETDGRKLYFNVQSKQISTRMDFCDSTKNISFPKQNDSEWYFIRERFSDGEIDFGFYDADGNIAFASTCTRTPPHISMVSEEVAEMRFSLGTGTWSNAFYNIRTHELSEHATMNAFHLQNEAMAYCLPQENGFVLYIANAFSPLYTAVQCPFALAKGEIESIIDISPIADNCVQIEFYQAQTFNIVTETVEIPISISDISAGNAGEVGYYGFHYYD